MIKIEFIRSGDNLIYGYKIIGHSKVVSRGGNVVCAAVSVLACTTVLAIQKLLGTELIGYSEEGIQIIKIKESNRDIQLLLETMYLGISEIRKQYPKQVRIIEKRRK